MARNHANNGRVFRAVITRIFADESRTFTQTWGPYDNRHTAQAQITSAETQAERSHGEYRDSRHAHTVSAHIESAEVVWMREADRHSTR